MTKNATALGALVLGPVMLFLSACGGDDIGAPEQASGEVGKVSTIEGEVFYRERMMLPPGAELEVQLQDISRADAMATVMTSVLIQPQGGPPYPFTINYDPTVIDPRMRYALRATISRGDRLLFTTTEYIDPFSGNPVQIMVQRVAEPVTKAPAEEPPPAQADDAPPAAVPAGPAENDATQATWLLQTLHGEAAALGAGGAPADMVLDHEEGSVAGFAGCNRYSGGFSSEGHSVHGTPIKFGPLASTMRACVDGAELEQAFLQMLDSVDAYRISGQTLELLRADSVVATFSLR